MSEHNHIEREPVNARIFPPPPVMLLLFLAAGFLLEKVVPLVKRPAAPPPESIVIGGLVVGIALAIGVLAVRQMRRHKTTVFPGGTASALVQAGVFSRSRNPIYLSMVLLMLGLGIATARPWLILLAPALLFYLQERVIKREEAYLAARFGAEYSAYRQKVRRWF